MEDSFYWGPDPYSGAIYLFNTPDTVLAGNIVRGGTRGGIFLEGRRLDVDRDPPPSIQWPGPSHTVGTSSPLTDPVCPLRGGSWKGGNLVEETGGAGIRLKGAIVDGSIDSNKALENEGAGIHAEGCALRWGYRYVPDVVISGNEVSGNEPDGIRVTGAPVLHVDNATVPTVVVESNTVSDHPSAGILVESYQGSAARPESLDYNSVEGDMFSEPQIGGRGVKKNAIERNEHGVMLAHV